MRNSVINILTGLIAVGIIVGITFIVTCGAVILFHLIVRGLL